MMRYSREDGAIWQAQHMPTEEGRALLEHLEEARKACGSKGRRLRRDRQGSVQNEPVSMADEDQRLAGAMEANG